MATPHVAGVCALIWAKYPTLQPHQVIIRLLGSVDRKPDFINCIKSGGRLNAARALSTDPLIANTTDWRYTADTAKPYSVSATVIDDAGVMSVRLIYKLNGTAADSMEMAAGSNDAYSGNIPGQPLNTTIEYAVSATDNDGNRTVSSTYAFKITSESDPRDKVGCCGQCVVTIEGLDESIQMAVQIPINVAFFLLPIMLLRRRNRRF
jgi:subtilisin family serine protease